MTYIVNLWYSHVCVSLTCGVYMKIVCEKECGELGRSPKLPEHLSDMSVFTSQVARYSLKTPQGTHRTLDYLIGKSPEVVWGPSKILEKH
jgi:hypothetical protein